MCRCGCKYIIDLFLESLSLLCSVFVYSGYCYLSFYNIFATLTWWWSPKPSGGEASQLLFGEVFIILLTPPVITSQYFIAADMVMKSKVLVGECFHHPTYISSPHHPTSSCQSLHVYVIYSNWPASPHQGAKVNLVMPSFTWKAWFFPATSPGILAIAHPRPLANLFGIAQYNSI